MLITASRKTVDHVSSLHEMFRLRRRIFYDRLHYKTTPTPDGEFDEYDSQSTIYIIHKGGLGVHSFVRLNPTLSGYMIADVWPEQMPIAPPRSPDVAEGSRLAVNPLLPYPERQYSISWLLFGMYDYCYTHGIRKIIGIMPPRVWRSVFIRRGLPLDYLSGLFYTDSPRRNEPARIGINPVSSHCLKRILSLLADFDHVQRPLND